MAISLLASPIPSLPILEISTPPLAAPLVFRRRSILWGEEGFEGLFEVEEEDPWADESSFKPAPRAS
eukprot:2880942-Pyramimonas_sp.AAC.1